MILIIDNYDSFTYNLAQALGVAGGEVDIIRNDDLTVKKILKRKPSAIILSPGPCSPKQAGICVPLITEIQKTQSYIPILGVCLGHQSLGYAFGADIIKAPLPIHGKVCKIKHSGASPLFDDIPTEILVTRYHSLIIDPDTLPPQFNIDAINIEAIDYGLIMSISHKQYPFYGIQFHPESIKTDFGQKMIDNFLNKVVWKS